MMTLSIVLIMMVLMTTIAILIKENSSNKDFSPVSFISKKNKLKLEGNNNIDC